MEAMYADHPTLAAVRGSFIPVFSLVAFLQCKFLIPFQNWKEKGYQQFPCLWEVYTILDLSSLIAVLKKASFPAGAIVNLTYHLIIRLG